MYISCRIDMSVENEAWAGRQTVDLGTQNGI